MNSSFYTGVLVLLASITYLTATAQSSDLPDSTDGNYADTAAVGLYLRQLDSIDAIAMPRKYALNVGFPLGLQLGRYLEAERHVQPTVDIDADGFWAVREGLEKAMRGRPGSRERVAALASRVERNYGELAGVIPVGILIGRGVLLDSLLFEQGIEQARQGKRGKHRREDELTVFAGSVLKERTVGYEAIFEVPDYVALLGERDRGVAIDINLADGRGWQRIRPGQHVTTTYATPGEKGIGVALRWRGERFESYSRLYVTAPLPGDMRDVQVADGATGGGGLGSRSRIDGLEVTARAGCDNVFDRPVIFIEGFDLANNNELEDIIEKFEPVAEQYQERGYDIFYVNLKDGRADIRRNAQRIKVSSNGSAAIAYCATQINPSRSLARAWVGSSRGSRCAS